MAKKDKSLVIPIAVTSILVIIVAGLSLYLLFKPYAAQKTPTASQPTTATTKTNQLVDAAAIDSQNKSKSISQLENLSKTETDKTKKGTYLSGIVDIYLNSNDPAQSVQAAKTYDDYSGDALSAASLAHSYEVNGDYKNAAKYYQVAADRSVKPPSPDSNAPYNDYMIKKQEMESKP